MIDFRRRGRHSSPTESAGLTRNSPCPIKDHFHNIRYCPDLKRKMLEVAAAASKVQAREDALKLTQSPSVTSPPPDDEPNQPPM